MEQGLLMILYGFFCHSLQVSNDLGGVVVGANLCPDRYPRAKVRKCSKG